MFKHERMDENLEDLLMKNHLSMKIKNFEVNNDYSIVA